MHILDTGARFSAVRFSPVFNPTPRRRYVIVRANLPFPKHQAKYHKELEAAIDAVERGCRLCVDVKRSLFSSKEDKILEKNDQTPVTIADFGVQALVSLQLSKLFPSIPLVAEEDSLFLRENNLVNSVVSEVIANAADDDHLSDADVLEAIDRGGKDAHTFCNKPATYWVLDPIDGTKGFLRGDVGLYVVGLALVVDNEIVLGVMGCPNWPGDSSDGTTGTLMLSHTGCGTWTKSLLQVSSADWTRRFVDACGLVNKARFVIQESQPWESLPLSSRFDAKIGSGDLHGNEIRLLPTCHGSLCKYLMVASGRASVFFLRARTERKSIKPEER
ncbi:putative PAP-specific phosphatase, mitochondrial isoform X2 [Raphanus sativus]|uniref:PAP-specific phosphatase, mitochondrial isoform X2 n=1 Tax=Raphanus sativus TaxID=3726 RepID=A0A6J0LBH7_RAPSA|nr:putative PAP-specific phosphatase, mitochondrial isoform X2 [Raphanus sativus]